MPRLGRDALPSSRDHEVATSNSTLNAFLGGRQKTWMNGSAADVRPTPRPRPHAAQQSVAAVLPSPAPSEEPSPIQLQQTLESPGPSPTFPETPEMEEPMAQAVLPPAPAVRAPMQNAQNSASAVTSPISIQSPGLPRNTSAQQPVNPPNGNTANVSQQRMNRAPSQLHIAPAPTPGTDQHQDKRARIGPPTSLDPDQLSQEYQKAIHNHISSCGGEQSLNNTTERPRYNLLRNACKKKDWFYLAFHQCFCLWTLNPQMLVRMDGFGDVNVNRDAFVIAGQLLRDNSTISPRHLSWLANFPEPTCNLLQRREWQETFGVGGVATCLQRLAGNWTTFTAECQQRQYPPLVEEMHSRLFLLSPTLQHVVFTATRRNIGIKDDGIYSQQVDEWFLNDQEDYAKLLKRRLSPFPPTETELEQRRQLLITRYKQFHQQRLQCRQQPPVGSNIENQPNQPQRSGSGSAPPRPPHQRQPSDNRQALSNTTNGYSPAVIPSNSPLNSPMIDQFQNLTYQPNAPTPNGFHSRQSSNASPVPMQQPHMSPYMPVNSPVPSNANGPISPQLMQAPPSHLASHPMTPVLRSNDNNSPGTQGQPMVQGYQNQMVQPQAAYVGPTGPVNMQQQQAFQRHALQRHPQRHPQLQAQQQAQYQAQHQAQQIQQQVQQSQQSTQQHMHPMQQMQQMGMLRYQQAQQAQQQRAQMWQQGQAQQQQQRQSRLGPPRFPAQVFPAPANLQTARPMASPQAPNGAIPTQNASRHSSLGSNTLNSPGPAPAQLNALERSMVAQLTQQALFPPADYIPQPSAPNPSVTALHQSGVRSPRLVPTDPPVATAQHSKRYYQVVVDFATKPILVPANKVTTYEFQMSKEDFARVANDVYVDGEPVARRRVARGSRQYRLRCAKAGKNEELGPADWVVKDHSWPEHIFVEFNGHYPELRRKQPHHGKDLALDLTPHLKHGDGAAGANSLKVSISQAKGQPKPTYALAIEIIEVLDHQQVTEQILEKNRIPADETLKKIKAILSGSDDDDIVAVSTDLTIDLTDPFMAKIFDTPVRGKYCLHRECFDLYTFLETRASKFRKPMEPCMPDVWKCPRCGKDARPMNLVLDDFLLDVRQKLEQQDKLDTKAILVNQSGEWKPKEEEMTGTGRLRKGDADGDDSDEGEPLAQRAQRAQRAQPKKPAPEVIEID